jgi:uncharacterized YigZ family protein
MVIFLKTIKDAISYSEIIKKSKFYTFLHPINSLEHAKKILDTYKNDHKEATHICYAYILDENTFKYSDDGEPTNSAGIPIYQVLKNQKLIYVLCVVIRYYGGIKLGVGGLSHAYSSGAINSLKIANVIEYKKTNEYIIETTYSEFDNLNYFLTKKGIDINDKQFLDNVFLCIYLDEDTLVELKQQFPALKITLSE